jgi:succinate dehydrogenase / fumarate reductase, cytochrome b subunit
MVPRTGKPLPADAEALWIIRFELLTSVLFHRCPAFGPWARARGPPVGGGRRYQSRKAPLRAAHLRIVHDELGWPDRGPVVIVYHLLHLTTNTIHPGGASSSPYDRVVNGFGIWWVVLSYILACWPAGSICPTGCGARSRHWDSNPASDEAHSSTP